MNSFITYIAWALLAASLAACAGVAYGGYWLQEEAKERGAMSRTADQKATEAAQVSRLKALVAETRADRTELESISQADIVSIANEFEAAGRSVGVVAKVSTAIPAGNPKDIPGGASLHSLAFIVQAEGSYAGLFQLIRVLEKFPGFATVEQFDLERVSALERNARPWRTTIRIRIFTTSDITA